MILDKFVKPRGGAIKKIDTKGTGITREHIENLGEDFHSVREEAIEGKFSKSGNNLIKYKKNWKNLNLNWVSKIS